MNELFKNYQAAEIFNMAETNSALQDLLYGGGSYALIAHLAQDLSGPALRTLALCACAVDQAAAVDIRGMALIDDLRALCAADEDQREHTDYLVAQARAFGAI